MQIVQFVVTKRQRANDKLPKQVRKHETYRIMKTSYSDHMVDVVKKAKLGFMVQPKHRLLFSICCPWLL